MTAINKIDLFPAGKPNIKSFPGKKGKSILFIKSNRVEIIQHCSRAKDVVKTDKQEYSFDFLQKWFNFGFIKIL